MTQLLLEPVAVGDVGQCVGDRLNAVGPVDGRSVKADVNKLSILALSFDVYATERFPGESAGEQVGVFALRRFLFRHQHIRFADHFLRLVAKDLLGGAAPDRNRPVRGEADDSDG
jgi:hypothetical protein